MDWKLELVIVPVSNVDRAKAFYADQLGWPVDVDHDAGEAFRVVQLTPPGSACSITFGKGVSESEPGSLHGLHLIVVDIEAARLHLVERGVGVTEIFHFEQGERRPGPDPQRGDYNSFCSFHDPDGNTWVVQEVRRAGPPA
ncbi:MAG: VOC family protein [Ilumatobacteraceae bacterium]